MIVHLKSLAYALPAERCSSRQLETRLRADNPHLGLRGGAIEALTGVRTLLRAGPHEHPSDLAAAAGRATLAAAGLGPGDIDLLVFASACQDITEPATANLVAVSIGSGCPVVDVKNACNSFLNGVQIAAALVRSGEYGRVLITTGETPSRVAQTHFADREAFRLGVTGLTLGDAGAAGIVERGASGAGIYFTRFVSLPSYWDAAVVRGGGSRHLDEPDAMRFVCDGARLRDGFGQFLPEFVHGALCDAGRGLDDFAAIFFHQVSMKSTDLVIGHLGLPRERVVLSLDSVGNLASASLPVAIARAQESGRVTRGDQALVIGLASGISAGVLMFEVA